MSSNTIELEFGDGQYLFALPLPQINELQRKTGIGIGGLYARVMKGITQIEKKTILLPGQAEFYALDIIETVRHGLIGGGKGTVNGEEVHVTPLVANRLVDTYVLSRPFTEGWNHAAAILIACIMGYEPPKKAPAGEEPAPESETETSQATDGSTTS